MNRRVLAIAVALLLSAWTPSNIFAESSPYPQSTAITGITWDDAANIVRFAGGSDNWPITWADDDNLYTAYGDGYGFVPNVPGKLSLGFAKVQGDPPTHSGINIRSPDELTGDGSAGKKASGMLMVDGVLYMWVRNANNNGAHSALWWSTDHAVNWTKSVIDGDPTTSVYFEEFGYPTFINFGQNYAGARDSYVYTVSHDNPSAYTRADRFILMRVPKTQITNETAYEFFKELDAGGNPVWTSDRTQRGAVFTHTGYCFRSCISYNAGIQRYLWWQAKYDVNNVDGRHEGGFGIFDAPEPWGPWTTVYYVRQKEWDVGGGETGSFPPKWISEDGKTMYLVFSGDDAFSVRGATLTLNPMSSNPPAAPTGLHIVAGE